MKIIAENGTAIDHRKVRRIIHRTMKLHRRINQRLSMTAEAERLAHQGYRALRLVSNRPGKFRVKSA